MISQKMTIGLISVNYTLTPKGNNSEAFLGIGGAYASAERALGKYGAWQF